MSKKIDVKTGDRYGRLTIVRELPSRNGYRYVECLCDCGNYANTKLTFLRIGQSKSCGCLRKENVGVTSHNDSHNKLYKVWTSMKQRCLNSKNQAYTYYGGRGITICSEWLNYTAFKNWAYDKGYADNLTIDRIDNNGNYTPGNCRWVTMAVQCTNKRQRQGKK